MNPSARGSRRPAVACLPALAIAAAAVWIFWPALHGGWLWDDGLEIAGNGVLRSSSGWWSPWLRPAGMDFLPLKDTLQWIEWRLWGDRLAGYHLANLALHVAGSLLLWRLLGKLGVRHGWLGGLLFAVHPAAVESVAWISEQKNLLSLPLLLLAFGAYVDYDRTARRRDQVAALAWFVAAMLCKTSVVMLPVLLLVYVWWRRGRISRRDLWASAPFFGVSLGLGLVAVFFQQQRAIGAGGAMPGFAPRLAQSGWSAVAYVRECVFPAGLMPIYPEARTTLPSAIPWLGLAALAGLLWVWRKSWGRHALFGLAWIVVNLIPVLGIVPIAYLRVSPRADHFLYLSLAGSAGLAAGAFAAAIGSPRQGAAGGVRLRRAGLWLLAAAVVAGWTATGRAYAAIFRSDEALWTYAVGSNPAAWLARNNLGKDLLQRDDAGGAARQFEAALAVEPESAEVHVNLGAAYERQGRTAAARVQYRDSLRLDPAFAGAHYNLGRLLLESGETEAAADEFRAALRLDPAYAVAHNNLGLALARLGRLPEAMTEYRLALGLDPGLAEAHLNLGNVFLRQGDPARAAEEYRHALRIDSRYAAAHHNLGYALQQLGRPQEAAAEFEAGKLPPPASGK
jgi:tetratricopeptide (TPR) repeat protein